MSNNMKAFILWMSSSSCQRAIKIIIIVVVNFEIIENDNNNFHLSFVQILLIFPG